MADVSSLDKLAFSLGESLGAFLPEHKFDFIQMVQPRGGAARSWVSTRQGHGDENGGPRIGGWADVDPQGDCAYLLADSPAQAQALVRAILAHSLNHALSPVIHNFGTAFAVQSSSLAKAGELVRAESRLDSLRFAVRDVGVTFADIPPVMQTAAADLIAMELTNLLSPPRPLAHYLGRLREATWRVGAWHDGHLIGVMVATLRDREKYIYMDYLAVKTDWRSRGIGSAMLRQLLSLGIGRADLVRVDFVTSVDHPNSSIYDAIGFTRRGCASLFAIRRQTT